MHNETVIELIVTSSNTTLSNVTENPVDCTEYIPAYWGYISAAISVVCFGLMYTPVKKYETGDGFFFQWIQCTGGILVGFALQLILGEPRFYPLAMLGGCAWVTGNLCVVPIFKTVGMSVGFCVWGLSNLIFGWATGRFGLFGLTAEPPDSEAMNDIGVCVAVISAIVFSSIKAELNPYQKDNTINLTIIYDETNSVESKPETSNAKNTEDNSSVKSTKTSLFDRLSVLQRRIIGIFLCVFSGFMYSQTFTPGIYIQEHYEGATKNSLNYVFATYCGAYILGTFYFAMYCILKRNKPKLYPQVVIPGLISGVMWGVATGSWFITNKSLSEPVAFTILSTLPPAMGSLIGAFFFKEIKSTQNKIKLTIGLLTSALSAILSALSKTAQASC